MYEILTTWTDALCDVFGDDAYERWEVITEEDLRFDYEEMKAKLGNYVEDTFEDFLENAIDNDQVRYAN